MSRRLSSSLVSLAILAVRLVAADQAQAADVAPAQPSTVEEVVVTARRLNEARAAIQPQLGASVYTIDSKAIAAMPGGDDVALNQIVLQSPGVAQDSFCQLHVRGEHNGLQFRLKGVILPEGLSVFSQALSPRLADKVALITGALPAQYGLRTAGIIDITTKNGVYRNAGDVSIYGGAHGEIQPGAEYGGSSGNLNYFASASYVHTGLGVESPSGDSTPAHDVSDQFQGFAYVEDIIDSATRVSAILGASQQRFQIPVRSGLTPSLVFGPGDGQPLRVDGQTTYPSEQLNQTQKEATYYGVLSLLRATERFTGQFSVFGRYSTLDYFPDPLGDLLFTGLSQRAVKADVSVGFQGEAVYNLTDFHILRAGLIGQIDRATSDTAAQVIDLAADGSQISDQPATVTDQSARTAYTFSAYLQDEWKLTPDVTLNYGLRFDEFHGLRDESQLSPRVNIVWRPYGGTTLHAGYARYFSPPPFELVGASAVAQFVGTTAAAASGADTVPYAERASYYDVGLSQKIGRDVTLGVDSYYKRSRNLVDEGQFGAPIILTPFNYANGRQYGLELSANYVHGPLSAYANGSLARNEGKGIVSSQFNFAPDELAYIASHFIHLDHDQRLTASAGATYLWRAVRFGADLIYGSGLRATGPGGVPNGDHLPAYLQVNASLSHRFETGPLQGVEARFDVINLFDERYEIRDGSGVGVGAPQFGARRGVFGGLTKSF